MSMNHRLTSATRLSGYIFSATEHLEISRLHLFLPQAGFMTPSGFTGRYSNYSNLWSDLDPGTFRFVRQQTPRWLQRPPERPELAYRLDWEVPAVSVPGSRLPDKWLPGSPPRRVLVPPGALVVFGAGLGRHYVPENLETHSCLDGRCSSVPYVPAPGLRGSWLVPNALGAVRRTRRASCRVRKDRWTCLWALTWCVDVC